LVVGILVGWGFSKDQQSEARKDAEVTCAIQADGRLQGNGRAFVQGEILDIADEAFQSFPKRFQERRIDKINAELARVRALDLLPENGPTRVKSFTDLQDMIELRPPIDCDAELGR
jgi:hypothetical protein